jgi:hypothetical protein
MLAERAWHANGSLDERLAFAFRQVVCRVPQERDRQLLKRAFDRQLAVYRADTAAAQQLLTVGERKRDEKLPLDEHAALAAVCLALFNIDEALTRE